MPDDNWNGGLPADWLCVPCQVAVHDACMGQLVFCCCLTESMIEAEETPDGHTR